MSGGLSRVTIVAPRSRVDVALPSDVPLADLLPTLLGFAGTATEESRHGWTLSRLGSGELDSSATAEQLAVRDGELLYLRPRGDEAPVTVFDDVVDALATGGRRLSRWTPSTSRAVGLTAGVLALLAGAVALPFAGPPYSIGGLIGAALAATLLVAAMVFARALGDARTGTAFALVATVYAGVGGLLVLAGDTPPSSLTVAHVAVAATLAMVAATVASIGVPGATPVFLAAGVVAAAVLATMGLAALFDIRPAAGAAVTVLAASATLPLLPMLAYRLVGLPVPNVPTERDQLLSDGENVNGIRILELARRADAFLAALVSALAVIVAGTALLVAGDGLRGLLLALVLGLLSLARARWFLHRAQRLPLLLAGGVALAAAAVAVFAGADQVTRLVGVFGATIAIAAASIGFGLASQRRQNSPLWGRVLDVVEVLLILALAPLVVWEAGLLEWIRAIRG